MKVDEILLFRCKLKHYVNLVDHFKSGRNMKLPSDYQM